MPYGETLIRPQIKTLILTLIFLRIRRTRKTEIKGKRIYPIYLKLIAQKTQCQLSDKSDKSVSLKNFRFFRAFRVQKIKPQILGILGIFIMSASEQIPKICEICVLEKLMKY